MSDDVEVKEQETEVTEAADQSGETQQEAEQETVEQPKARKGRQPKEGKQPETKTVTNLRKNPVTIGSKSYKQNEKCTLYEADLANERLMAKVNRLIELKIIG
jgi:hypothetical protein